MTATTEIKIDYWKIHNHFTFEDLDVRHMIISFIKTYNVDFFSPLVISVHCEGRILGGDTHEHGEKVEITFNHFDTIQNESDDITFSGTAIFTETDIKSSVKGALKINHTECIGWIEIPKEDEFRKFIEAVSKKRKWS